MLINWSVEHDEKSCTVFMPQISPLDALKIWMSNTPITFKYLTRFLVGNLSHVFSSTLLMINLIAHDYFARLEIVCVRGV